MYTVGVRDHLLVVSPSQGEHLGRSQALTGESYTVSVEVQRPEPSDYGIALDVGQLRQQLRAVLDDLDHQNLNEHPAFSGHPSPRERLARHIHEELSQRMASSYETLTVTLHESVLSLGWQGGGEKNARLPDRSALPGATVFASRRA